MASKEEKRKKEKLRRMYYMSLFDIEKRSVMIAMKDAQCDFGLFKTKDGSYIFGRSGGNGGTKPVRKKDAFTILRNSLNDRTLKKMGSSKAVKAYINLIDINAREKDDYYIDTIPICRRLFPEESEEKQTDNAMKAAPEANVQ